MIFEHIRNAAVPCRALLIAVAFVGLALARPASAEELIVYGSTPADEWAVYKAAFEAENPDITLTHFSDASGIIIARILAERSAPKADVIFDMPATGILTLVEEGLIEPYAPAGLAEIDARLIDKHDPPHWFAFSGYAALVCYNREEGAVRNIPPPTSWRDLADPIYRGQITMSDPNSSGTGMMMVAGILATFGEEEGWAFLDRLHENIAFYTHSGSKPCKLAGAGEYTIGLSNESAPIREIKGGAPIDPVVPEEGMFWEIASVGMVKGTDNQDAAKRFLDWASSRGANALFADHWSIVAIRDLAEPRPYLPENFLDRLQVIDFQWVADNRERIGEEWQRRYATKVEPE
ncbi:MAG: extracellular solute-binding protein [Rhodospirillaceae bacterium]|nr:extracellular solute-binding protein [Rhodospirillaceae bacterium]